ncbi:MAG: hypothetical protein ABIP97_11740 [Chthoniobacterales bacterium]
MRDDLCILISTCDRYRDLADFTRAQIESKWPVHPPIFVCGIRNVQDGLELRDDPANWMQVTRSACMDLRTKGFQKAYLILEDHPPFGPCHSGHLNDTLPRAMEHFNATCMALSGPGQHRKQHGSPKNFARYTFDHIHPDALWKFPLHPALWNLDRLIALLDWLIETLPVTEQNPWAFERKGGDPKAALTPELKEGSYRVIGSQMPSRPFFWLRRMPLALLQFVVDVARFLIRIILGDEARRLADEKLWGIYCPYDGPYPLFWSGIMRKGRLSEDLVFWLAITGRSRFLESLPPSCK